MKISLKKLLREPLVHFLIIGVAIFLWYGLTRDVVSEAPKRIVISSGQLEQLTENFKRTRMRSPTQGEMAGMVESLVREEVFYREALAMGLDQNDPQVRRRMRMKLEFILEDLSSQTVTDEKLSAYMQKHPEKFRREAQTSFQQVYLNREKHKDLKADAKKLLTRLNEGASPETMGDPTMVPYDLSLATQSEVARSFGDVFAEEMIKLTPGDWVGPIYSEYGGHLVKVSERNEASQPALDEIRPVVEREYLAQLKEEQKAEAYQSLREGYEITIEPLKFVPYTVSEK